MARIAFLGLGAMGQRMALRLLEAGHELRVWNRSPAASADLVTAGAVKAATPREAAKGANMVWSMVFDDAASQAVWLDPEAGAAGGMGADAMAIESSTLSPAWVSTLHDALARQGLAFIDAPVAGSRPQAKAGQLVFMVGGDDAAVESARPLFAAVGSAVNHVGPVGAGTWLKLSVNALFATQVVAVAEQLEFLQRAGLDVARAADALKTMPVMSPAAAGAAALMLKRDYTPQAPVDLIAKDLGYALGASQQFAATLPVLSAVAAQFQAASRAGMGPENLVAVAKLYAQAATPR